GTYSFLNQTPGTYRLRAVVPAGMVQTSANPADLAFNTATANVNFGVYGRSIEVVSADGVANPNGSALQVFDAATRALIRTITPYAGYLGPISVASGDINGDGILDVITGAGVTAPHVKVFDGVTGAEIRSFFAYGAFG